MRWLGGIGRRRSEDAAKPWKPALLLPLALIGVAACRSTTPDDLDSANVALGTLTQPSWVGGLGGIVLDDGSGYWFDVLRGARRYTLSHEERRELLKAVDDADFFDLPERLHNNDITDGSETTLFVATPSTQHWSVNYVHDSGDYRTVADALGRTLPGPQSGAPVEPVELVRDVKAYLERGADGEKRRAVSRWLGRAEAMIAATPK